MELIDYAEEKLTQPAIVLGAVQNMGLDTDKFAIEKIMLYLALPKLQVVQVKNTVFSYVQNEKEGVVYAEVKVFNMDSVQNLIKNTYRFLSLIQGRGITMGSITAKDPAFLRAMVKLIPKLKSKGTDAAIGESKKAVTPMYLTHFKFGKKKLATRKLKNEFRNKKRYSG